MKTQPDRRPLAALGVLAVLVAAATAWWAFKGFNGALDVTVEGNAMECVNNLRDAVVRLSNASSWQFGMVRVRCVRQGLEGWWQDEAWGMYYPEYNPNLDVNDARNQAKPFYYLQDSYVGPAPHAASGGDEYTDECLLIDGHVNASSITRGTTTTRNPAVPPCTPKIPA